MTRLSFPVALVAVAAAAALVAGTTSAAPATAATSRPLAIGDTIIVTKTRVFCLALVSSGKNGVGCILFDKKSVPIRGTYAVGMAIDGTTVLTQVKPDGNPKIILKRKPQAVARRSSRVYSGAPGDVYLLPIDATHKLACKITDVKPGQAAPLYRGIKIACWRIVATGLPVPRSDAIQISDRMAAIVSSDAKGVFGTAVLVKQQPA